MTNPTSKSPPKLNSRGCLPELSWLGASFSLPYASPAFYREAARRQSNQALFFFAILMGVASIFMSLGLYFDMNFLAEEFLQTYDRNQFPTIVIEDGLTTVDGQTPIEIFNQERVFIAIDTSGQIQEIDVKQYVQGVLLTQDTLHLLNNGQYQRLSLIDLHEMTESSRIVIDRSWVDEFASYFFALIILVSTGLIFIFNFFLRPFYLGLFAMLLLGITKFFRPNIQYSTVLITGIYAHVPALTIGYLLTLSGVTVPFMQTLLLIAFWSFGLSLILNDPLLEENTVNLQPALIMVPFYGLLVIQLFYSPAWSLRALWTIFIPSLIATIIYASRNEGVISSEVPPG